MTISYHVSREYQTLRQQAHERPVTPCGPHSLVRFRALWVETANPEQRANRLPNEAKLLKEEVEQMRNVRNLLINSGRELFLSFQEKFGASSTAPLSPVSDFDILESGQTIPFLKKGEVMEFTAIWHSLLLKINITYHSDYISLTQIIDPIKIGDPQRVPSYSMMGKPPATRSPRQDLEENMEKLKTILQAINANPDPRSLAYKNTEAQHHLELHNASEFLYQKIWDLLDEDLGMPKPLGGCPANNSELYLALFSEFRGVVLPEKAGKILERPKGHVLTQNYTTFSSLTKAKSHRDALKEYWPFIKASNQSLSRADIVACSVIRRGAVYVSTLGYSNWSASAATESVRYLVLASVEGRWQIGRLVNRINRLGCYRLMALRNLPQLQKTSLEIRILGQVLDRLNFDLSNRDLDKSTIAECLARLQKLGRGAEGGLAYRVARSRYYVNAFNALAQDLHAERIEGFQPYDAFVRRRLYETYHFIDRLGDRVDRVRSRFNTMLEGVQTEALRRTQVSSEQLLHVGDYVGWVAVTYYGGHLLSLLIKHNPKSAAYLMSSAGNIFGISIDRPDTDNILLLMSSLIVFCFWFLIKRTLHRKVISDIKSIARMPRFIWSFTKTNRRGMVAGVLLAFALALIAGAVHVLRDQG